MFDSFRIAHALDRVARQLDVQMQSLLNDRDTLRVGPVGAIFLINVRHLQPCSIQTLCTRLGRDNSQMTRLTRSLEEKGLLQKETNEKDRRVTLLRLTPAGEEFVDITQDVISEAVEDLVRPLPEDHKLQLAAILEVLGQSAARVQK